MPTGVYIRTPEYREKMRAAKTGGTLSGETKRKISQSHKGIMHTEETKKKIRETNKGKRLSKKTEFKKGQAPWNTGIVYTDERKNKTKTAWFKTYLKEKGIDKSEYKRWRMIKRKHSSYKYCAKKRGIDFYLSLEEFEVFWQKNCTYCGLPIETIGLDRIDSDFGYFIKNVIPCCKLCNQMKSNLSKDYFFEHIKLILDRATGRQFP